jgi:hypothetical protein
VQAHLVVGHLLAEHEVELLGRQIRLQAGDDLRLEVDVEAILEVVVELDGCQKLVLPIEVERSVRAC